MTDTKAPREWRIVGNTLNRIAGGRYSALIEGDVWIKQGDAVHVIEKSAYDDLEERYELACNSDNAWRDRAEINGKKGFEWQTKLENCQAQCEKLAAMVDDMIEGFEGHFGEEFWDSPLGKTIKPRRAEYEEWKK